MRSLLPEVSVFHGFGGDPAPHNSKMVNDGGSCVRLKPEPPLVYVDPWHEPWGESYDFGG